MKSAPLFTKPKRSRLAPFAKASRPSPSLAKGHTRDVDQAFERFQISRQTAPRVVRS